MVVSSPRFSKFTKPRVLVYIWIAWTHPVLGSTIMWKGISEHKSVVIVYLKILDSGVLNLESLFIYLSLLLVVSAKQPCFSLGTNTSTIYPTWTLLLPNFWLFIFYVSKKKKKKSISKNRFWVQGRNQAIWSLMADWGLNRENQEPRARLESRAKPRSKLNFWWDLIA